MSVSVLTGTIIVLYYISRFLLEAIGVDGNGMQLIVLSILLSLPLITTSITSSLLSQQGGRIFSVVLVGTIGIFLSSESGVNYIVSVAKVSAGEYELISLLNGILKALSLGAAVAMILTLLLTTLEVSIAWVNGAKSSFSKMIYSARPLLLVFSIAFLSHRVFEFWLNGWESIISK